MPRPGRLTAAELRGLFLFTDLDDDQLAWVAATGEVVDVPASTALAREGDPAEDFYVLLAGTLSMSRRVRDTDVEIVRTSERGVFCGAVQFYFGDSATRPYATTSRAQPRSAHRRGGSATWSTRPSSTRRRTGRRSSRPISPPGSTPPSSCWGR